MECEICGKYYSVAHECAGLASKKLSEREAAPVPTGFAPLYYVRLAFNIMRWDDVSIRRASRDQRALVYGAFFWTVAAAVVVFASTFSVVLKSMEQSGLTGGLAGALGLVVGFVVLIIVVVVSGIVTLLQLGLCHLIAKWFFGATGTFAGILRPLLLGSPINVLALIPVVGPIAAALLWAAVLMVVFEEINHIRRVQAFAISYGVNLVFFAVSRAFS